MARVDDVIKNYLDMTGLSILSERTKKYVAEAIRYGFE